MDLFISQLLSSVPKIAPMVSNVQVDPINLPRFTVGEVTIFAQVSDPSSVKEVWAEVKKPDGTEEKRLSLSKW